MSSKNQKQLLKTFKWIAEDCFQLLVMRRFSFYLEHVLGFLKSRPPHYITGTDSWAQGFHERNSVVKHKPWDLTFITSYNWTGSFVDTTSNTACCIGKVKDIYLALERLGGIEMFWFVNWLTRQPRIRWRQMAVSKHCKIAINWITTDALNGLIEQVV